MRRTWTVLGSCLGVLAALLLVAATTNPGYFNSLIVANGLFVVEDDGTVTAHLGPDSTFPDTGAVPWETPGTIGSTTPNSGAFTTLSSTSSATVGGGLLTTGGAVTLDRTGAGQFKMDWEPTGAAMNFYRPGANYIRAYDSGGTLNFQTDGDHLTNRLQIHGSGVNVAGTLSATDTATFSGAVNVAGTLARASESNFLVQSQAGVYIGIDSDNDGTTGTFKVQRHTGGTPADLFQVAESGAITAHGAIDWTGSYDLADATNRVATLYANNIRLGSYQASQGTLYLYGDSGYGGGEIRVYNGATGDDTVDYWSMYAGYAGGGYGDFSVRRGSTVAAQWSEVGHFLPGANETYDLGSASRRWKTVYGDLVSSSNVVVDGVIDFQSAGVTVGAGGDLTMTSPEPIVSANSGTTDSVTSVNGDGGWFILRPATGHTITFVDDNSALDLAGNFVADHGNDTLFIMNIGSNQFIEVSRTNNQ